MPLSHPIYTGAHDLQNLPFSSYKAIGGSAPFFGSLSFSALKELPTTHTKPNSPSSPLLKKPRLENVTPPAAATSYLPQYCHQTASFPLQWIIWDRLYSPGRDSCYICYRLRSWKALQSAPHHHPNPKQNSAFRPKEPDLEFGFDKGRPTAKPAGNGGPKHNGHRPFENGEIRAENKPTESTAA
ncbi:hypothetical protein CK203_089647 [Vitis vinifera]|uniref:Uncharacterized protein n=1 Tax=Vitis vinifera TaxID=29760 RepID=A0A438EHW3_VITVI|nr:hypothetical protein CK203_089647 [Vitis vinifera]